MRHADTISQISERRQIPHDLLRRGLGFSVLLARRKPLGFAGLLVLMLMIVVAAAPGRFSTHPPGGDVGPRYRSYCLGPHDTFLCPTKVDPGVELAGKVVTPPSIEAGRYDTPLGTDQLGRDVYSRIVWGTRVAVLVGFGTLIVSTSIALVIGVSSGYLGGVYDLAPQRVVDAVMAFPPLVVLLALPNMIGGPSVSKLILILGVLAGIAGSRVIRSAVLAVGSHQYIDAARAIGAHDMRIMLRHVIPNIVPSLIVLATIGLGATILAESALSFVGLGVQENSQPTWGYMLNLGRQVASQYPWQAIWPGLAIAIAVYSVNMLGDALRDLLDPRLRGADSNFS
jgi:peptide/nickel transport system permease protein